MVQFILGEQIGILWRAFQLKGVDDDIPKKAQMARKFKALMEPGTLFIQQTDGSFYKSEDPRPEQKSFPQESCPLDFTGDEAKYLNECLGLLCKEKFQDKPVLTAAMADDVEHLRDDVLPAYWAEPSGVSEDGPK